MELYNFIHDIKKKGFDVIYFDTDSVITTCNIKKHADLLKKYQWDGCGNDLGCVKNEC